MTCENFSALSKAKKSTNFLLPKSFKNRCFCKTFRSNFIWGLTGCLRLEIVIINYIAKQCDWGVVFGRKWRPWSYCVDVIARHACQHVSWMLCTQFIQWVFLSFATKSERQDTTLNCLCILLMPTWTWMHLASIIEKTLLRIGVSWNKDCIKKHNLHPLNNPYA